MVKPTMAWLSTVSSKASHINTRNLFSLDKPSSVTLGILSFETAKTMSRLIHLYKSLSDDDLFNLQRGVMKSKGVAFLNSHDERFLLSLACAEKLEDLNRAVNTVSRLGQKCTDEGLKRFDQTYAEMNLGFRDFGKLDYGSKSAEKLVEKMEKYVKATANLHGALEGLAEMEISERKIKGRKQNLGQKQANNYNANTDYFDDRISFQRKQVKHYRDISLWSQTFDQSVNLMARIITIIYGRICVVFSPFVSDLPRTSKNEKSISHQKTTRMRIHPDTNYMELTSKSGPITKSSKKITSSRVTKSGPLPKNEEIFIRHRIPINIGKKKRVTQLAPESTVGGAGLALRYANIIIHAERYLYAPTCIDDDARGYLYELLPENLKLTVRGKLWGHWCTRVEESGDGYSLAEGWREALEEMMTWLAPMAHDTLKWQQERYLEKQRFDAKPTVMLFQTLHFADLEKTEVAIVEVLVGLSCIYRYENKRSVGGLPGMALAFR